MQFNVRSTHRDIAYFYVGLIIAFSFSGIFLNHRQSWHPRRYSYSIREFTIAPAAKEAITADYISKFTHDQQIEDELRRFQVVDQTLKISYANNDVEVDITTGKGKIETYRTTPLLGQMTKLHQDTSKWWIYYSDVFGAAMMVIAITGMFIEKGKNSFRSRGLKLALAGLLFPLIFLFLLS